MMPFSRGDSDKSNRPSFFRRHFGRHQESPESSNDRHSSTSTANDHSQHSTVEHVVSRTVSEMPVASGHSSPSLQPGRHTLTQTTSAPMLLPTEVHRDSQQPTSSVQTFEPIRPVSASMSDDMESIATNALKAVQAQITSSVISAVAPIDTVVSMTDETGPVLEKVSLWDKAYDALKKADDEKIRHLVDEYEALLKRQLLSGSQQGVSTKIERNTQNLPEVSVFDPVTRYAWIDEELKSGKAKHEMRGKIVIHGCAIDIQENLKKLAKGVEFLNAWVSQAVKASPEASLAWSLVCMAAPLLTKPAETEAANAEGLAYVSSRMHFYIALEDLIFPSYAPTQSRAAQNELCSRMIELYRSILEFQIRSILRFNNPSWRDDLFNEYNWNKEVIKIQGLEELIKSDSTLMDNKQLQSLLNDAKRVQEEILAINNRLLNNSNKQVDIADQLLQLKKNEQAERDEAKKSKYVQDLRLKNLYENFKNDDPRRIEGTCAWFLSQPSYTAWLKNPAGCLLVSADPGCGKSVLARHLIEYELNTHNPDRLICYFFFKDQVQNTLTAALCAVLHQLLIKKREMVEHIMPIANDDGERLADDRDGLLKSLKKILLDSKMSPVIILFDALDECNLEDREKLLFWIADFEKSDSFGHRHKFLLTSRPYPEITSIFDQVSGSLSIRISGDDNSEEISKEVGIVIKYRCKELLKKKHISKSVHNKLLEKLLAQENNTYLYVYLVFKELEREDLRQQSVKEFERWYKVLPKTVNEAYEAILSRTTTDETIRQKVVQLLTVMLAANRPLTVEEMQCAVKLDLSDLPNDHEDLDLVRVATFRHRIRTWCGLLVQIQDDKKVIFLHQTVREFLMSNDKISVPIMPGKWANFISPIQAQATLAKICIAYLSLENFAVTENSNSKDREENDSVLSKEDGSAFSEEDSSASSEEDDQERGSVYPFLNYAANNWDNHFDLGQCDKDEQISHLALALYTGNNQRFSRWVQENGELRWGYFSDLQHDESEPLIVSACMSSQTIFSLLLQKADINLNTALGEDALLAAIWSEREDHVSLLLDFGVSPNCQDTGDRTALFASIQVSSITITKLLLDYKVDTDGDSFVEALHDDDPRFIRCLLDHPLTAESVNKYETSVLPEAARANNYEAIKFLLEHEVDVNQQDSHGCTAVLWAATEGYLEVVRLLLSYNADPDIQDDDNNTALICAAKRGQRDVVNILLQHKAANNTLSKKDLSSALHWVAKGSEYEYEEPTLEKMVEGYKETLKVLIEAGAEINAPDDQGLTPLMQVVSRWEESGALTEHFIQCGADIHALDNAGRSCMHHVWNIEALQTLLLHEQKLDLLDYHGRTPLLCLILNDGWIDESSRIIGMYHAMLEHHADPTIKDQDGLHIPACLDGRFSMSSYDIKLNGKANLKARCANKLGWAEFSELNLDTCLGSDNGQIIWKQDGNLSTIAKNMALACDGRLLKAELKDNEGSWKQAYMWLDEKIANDDGELKVLGPSP